ncbi:hypothetical protein CK489_34075 [Bradyrhizobium sp. UFLA03-84]|uniref:hypothetical protein n=2 Tax=Bradyrhizobium TaxID=374 RepID=UPI00067EABFF|nr:hypothetical protein [Bradyrhizobium sp. UFLA03-84]PAY04275.1 hypothetical protein CK489_34075 [Bradyrhizobium sp. UFLA03-84]
MMTLQEYEELAAKYERLIEMLRDPHDRYQLEKLANSYRALANSASVLDRCARVLEALEQGRMK